VNRIGIGYDAHRLTEGRPLILGGVDIEYPMGLEGHSDADVLVHAVMDALLGAAAMGDIGLSFPDTEKKYSGISSLVLLGTVAGKLKATGYTICNIDSIIIAEKPKLRPYISRMEENIAAKLEINTSRISVKATTTEGMGFAGRQEGIAAQAVVMLDI
jgi:2-C-methyl-D-erythritol 2,4-cyclodiphosphate synthase